MWAEVSTPASTSTDTACEIFLLYNWLCKPVCRNQGHPDLGTSQGWEVQIKPEGKILLCSSSEGKSIWNKYSYQRWISLVKLFIFSFLKKVSKKYLMQLWHVSVTLSGQSPAVWYTGTAGTIPPQGSLTLRKSWVFSVLLMGWWVVTTP